MCGGHHLDLFEANIKPPVVFWGSPWTVCDVSYLASPRAPYKLMLGAAAQAAYNQTFDDDPSDTVPSAIIIIAS